MKKKLLVFMVITTLLIMAGCSSTPAEDQTTDDQQATATEEVQEDTAADTTQAEPAAATQADAAAEGISEQEAKEIALNHAGFKESDVEFTKVNKEMDDGVWQYEIEFVAGEMEYDYDINAETGDVMSFDSESVYDD